jgi:hypothetical protein
MTVRLTIPGLVGLAVLLLVGCGTTPPPSFEPTPKTPVAPATPAASAPAELAGTNCAFREVIVSVPVEGAHQVYQNLHVQLVAIVNPLNASVYDASSVRGMLNRLGPRTCAEVAKLLSESPTTSPHKLDQVHDAIITKIQPVIRQTLRDWPHASQYDVDVVIVSMYWTDSTVGRHDLAPW